MRDRGAVEIRKRYLTGRQPQIVARVSPHYGRLSGVLCGHGDVMLCVYLHLVNTQYYQILHV